jgi:hypothetical protein
MRRKIVGMIMLIVLFAVCLNTVQAEPLQQQTQVQITAPEMNAELRGMVAIVGSASVPDFQFYKVEFGVGPNPSQWAIVGSLHDMPVINGQLELWDTARIPDGVYSLRLQAVKRDGNYQEFFVRQVSVVNTRPMATATPMATPTVRPTPTLNPTILAQPTPTLLIIAPPTTGLSLPTVTPTLSRPMQRTMLPIDPETWGQSFLMGAVAMGAVLLLLGIVIGVRRLL